MKKQYQIATFFLIVFFSVVLFSTSGCKPEKENWQWCNDCTSENIIGNYTGTATHYKYQNDTLEYIETKDQEAYLKISQEGNQLKVQVGVVNLFGVNISGLYNNTYYLTFTGSRTDFSATIYKNEGKIKLVGSAKKLHSSGYTEELLDFEVFKTD